MHSAGCGKKKFNRRRDYSYNLNIPESSNEQTTPIIKPKHRIEEHGERSVTCEDIRLIMPTVLILLFTILVLSTVIPYAFSTAIKQLRDLQAREAAEAAGSVTVTTREVELSPTERLEDYSTTTSSLANQTDHSSDHLENVSLDL